MTKVVTWLVRVVVPTGLALTIVSGTVACAVAFVVFLPTILAFLTLVVLPVYLANRFFP